MIEVGLVDGPTLVVGHVDNDHTRLEVARHGVMSVQKIRSRADPDGFGHGREVLRRRPGRHIEPTVRRRERHRAIGARGRPEQDAQR